MADTPQSYNSSSISDSSTIIVSSTVKTQKKKSKTMSNSVKSNSERFAEFCKIANKQRPSTQEKNIMKKHKEKLEQVLGEYDIESQKKENKIAELHQRNLELNAENTILKKQIKKWESNEINAQNDTVTSQKENEEVNSENRKEPRGDMETVQNENDEEHNKNNEENTQSKTLNMSLRSRTPCSYSTPIKTPLRIQEKKDKTLTKNIQTLKSTPKTKRLTIFQEKLAEKMEINELINILTTINYQKGTDGKEEVEKYEEIIVKKIDKIVQENDTLKREIKNLQKTMQDNYNILEQANIERQQKINALEEEIISLKANNANNSDNNLVDLHKSLNAIGDLHRESSDEVERCKEKIIELEEIKQTNEKRIKENEDRMKEMHDLITKNDEMIKMITEKDENGLICSHIHIMKKLQKIEEEIQKKDSENSQKSVSEVDDQETNIDMKEQLYSSKVKKVSNVQQIGPTVHKRYSKSAVLIERTNTKMSLNEIRTILTRETRGKTKVKDILCRPARDGNTLIIKGQTEDETQELLKAIEEVQSLKDSITITIKSSNLKKIIILGIPKEFEHEKIREEIQKQYTTETPINIVKDPKIREGSKTYHLVLEVEDWVAVNLLRQQQFKLHFNICQIQLYLPVIRCTNCQRYGHTQEKCRGQEVCRYCAGSHKKNKTKYCYYMKRENEHRCINCLGIAGIFPHDAASRDCPAFQAQIQQRNNYAKSIIQNSTR